MQRAILILVCCTALLAACAAPAPATQEPPAEAATDIPPPPTSTSPPTETPTPEPTATPEPTPIPEGLFFRDDFSGELADGWEWINEEADRWTISEDGWLEITAGNPGLFVAEEALIVQVNLLSRAMPEGNVDLITHVAANPDENFKQAAIFFIQDYGNFVGLNIGMCTFCSPDSEGYGFYMDAFKDGQSVRDSAIVAPRSADTIDAYLKLAYRPAAGTITGYYATAPDAWQELFVVEGAPVPTLIALGAANVPGPPNGSTHDLLARYDFVELWQPAD